jgi:hypothetical protein
VGPTRDLGARHEWSFVLMVIDGYSIGGYWWVLMTIILVVINDYSIGGYFVIV